MVSVHTMHSTALHATSSITFADSHISLFVLHAGSLSYLTNNSANHHTWYISVCHILTYRWLRFRHIHCKSNGDLINILFRFRSYNSLILSITETQRDFQFARSTIAYCMHIKLAHAIELSRSLARQVKSDLHIPTIPLWNSEYLYDLNLGNFTQKS